MMRSSRAKTGCVGEEARGEEKEGRGKYNGFSESDSHLLGSDWSGKSHA